MHIISNHVSISVFTFNIAQHAIYMGTQLNLQLKETLRLKGFQSNKSAGIKIQGKQSARGSISNPLLLLFSQVD